ncbi:DUF1998 domain-containing protein [Streptomyces pharetrae]|uniref:DUF1998 domain-containing protein n=1 Tax=Streptomyces pharetrae TaxID=291370 RepID=UPI003460DDE1
MGLAPSVPARWGARGGARLLEGLGDHGSVLPTGSRRKATQETPRSGFYALLEGAANRLEISRDDIDGTVHTGADGMPSLLLFDTTPGGAGNVIRTGEHLNRLSRGHAHVWADVTADWRAASMHACVPSATRASTSC